MELPDIQTAIEALPAERRRELLAWLKEKERRQKPAGAVEPKPAVPRPVRVRKPATLRQAVVWTLVSLAAFLVADAAIFRSGWYYNYLEPASTTGQFELHLFWLRHTAPSRLPEVAVVGDSRIAEGFSARAAAVATSHRLYFWNLGVPGSSPRTWYYLLRDADPTRRRFASIVVAMDRYSDEDGAEDPRNRLADLNYVVGRLRVSDCPDFAQSFANPELRRGILTGCLFKGVTLRRDVQDLLENRGPRLKAAKAWRNDGHGYIDGYPGKPEDLTGLTADFASRTVAFPPGLKDWQRDSVRGLVMATKVPQTGRLSEYRRFWLGRVLELYKDSPTRIVFLELPGGPLVRPDSIVPSRFIDSLRSVTHPRITVLPRETFRDLEHPDVYADGLHLNHAGRPLFSARLGTLVAPLAGAN